MMVCLSRNRTLYVENYYVRQTTLGHGHGSMYNACVTIASYFTNNLCTCTLRISASFIVPLCMFIILGWISELRHTSSSSTHDIVHPLCSLERVCKGLFHCMVRPHGVFLEFRSVTCENGNLKGIKNNHTRS